MAENNDNSTQKLVGLNQIDRLAQSLNAIHEKDFGDMVTLMEQLDKIKADKETLQRVEEMLGGKSLRYLTQEEYDALSDEEKSNETIAYCITDRDISDCVTEEDLFKILPCYDTRENIVKEYTYDGVVGDREYLGSLVKISNDIYTLEDIKTFYDVVIEISSEDGIIDNLSLPSIPVNEQTLSQENKLLFLEVVLIILEDCEIEGYTFTRGIWVISEGKYAYVSRFKFIIPGEGEFKQLNKKFITIKPGENVEGQVMIVRTDNDEIIETTAEVGAEIFNISGGTNVAVGPFSHAEGYSTQAIGAISHSEGFYTTATGNYSHVEGYETTANGESSHAEGEGTRALGNTTHSEGYNTEAKGNYSHAEGNDTHAEGETSHAEGYETYAIGEISHVEGAFNSANGNCSHAEGSNSKADGEASHVEGFSNEAIGNYSHAEGSDTKAEGIGSHSEGSGTEARGNYSHSEGFMTIAMNDCQHVQGKLNIADEENKYAHIVGNGQEHTDDNISFTYTYSNAHTLDWDGNAWFAGDITIGADNKKLISEKDLPCYDTRITERKTYAHTYSASDVLVDDIFVKVSDDVYTAEEIKNFSNINITFNNMDGTVYETHNYPILLESDYSVVFEPDESGEIAGAFIGGNEVAIVFKENQGFSQGIYFMVYPGYGYTAEFNFDRSLSGEIKVLDEKYLVNKPGRIVYNHCPHCGTMEPGEIFNSSFNNAGLFSHAEGLNTKAMGQMAHAEGMSTKAMGDSSHAEGYGAEANGPVSHAEGFYTVANGMAQHVQGKFNIADDKEVYAHIVGNGTPDSESNAHTLDWAGNAWFAGNVTIGADNKKLATEEYVDSKGGANIETAASDKLNTQDKTIIGAINELELEIFETKADIIALDEYKLEQEDLPCYDSREYETVTFNYDGNLEGKETFNVGEGTFVKLTNDVSIHDLDGLRFSTITLYASDGTQEETGDMVLEGEYLIVQENVYMIGLDFANIVLALEDAELIEGNGINIQKGLWISHISAPQISLNFYIKSLTYNKHVSGELKKLDEKYLENKPGVCSEGKIYTYTIFDDPDERTTEIEVTHVGEAGAESFNKVGEHESIAIGACSHAEGIDTIAYGYASHAEGNENVALGAYSHVEGLYTYALGTASHAEGSATSAMRECSHAEGDGTIANGDSQHVQGKYNKKDTEDKYAHIVGNGKSKEERSNAHTLDWDGNAWFAGDVTIGADNKRLVAEKDLPCYDTRVFERRTYTLTNPSAQVSSDFPFEKVSDDIYTVEELEKSENFKFVQKQNQNGNLHEIEIEYLQTNDYLLYNPVETPQIIFLYSNAAAILTEEFNGHQPGFYLANYTNRGYHFSELSFDYTTQGELKLIDEDFLRNTPGKKTAEGGEIFNDYSDNQAALFAHAEGFSCWATDQMAHAEGYCTEANGLMSHAEGYYTIANGNKSHVEGCGCVTNAESAHAEGCHTIASSICQHVEGRGNIEDAAQKYLHIVGNGWENARSNAYTLDWSGNAWFAGKATVSVQPTDNNDLTTKLYVDNAIKNIEGEKINQLPVVNGAIDFSTLQVGIYRVPQDITFEETEDFKVYNGAYAMYLSKNDIIGVKKEELDGIPMTRIENFSTGLYGWFQDSIGKIETSGTIVETYIGGWNDQIIEDSLIPPTTDAVKTYVDQSITQANENLQSQINELFQNVSNGKTLIASAITDKGIEASGDETFSSLSDKINQIPVGPPGSNIIGYINENNDIYISLTELESGTYTLKLEDYNGVLDDFHDIGTVEVE